MLAFGRPTSAAALTAWTGGAQPSFTLPAMTGTSVTLAAQHADAVLVHFFATWCEPCREELPALMRLSQRGGPSLTVLAISVAEPDARVRRFVETNALKLPILLDRDRAVAKAWKVSILPTTFVLDSTLRPRLVVEGDYAWDSVDPKSLIDAHSAQRGPHQRQDQRSLREDDHARR